MREFCRVFAYRFAALFHHRRLDAELDAELRSHLEMATEMNLRKGMTAEEAHRTAQRDLGGMEQIKEIYRDQRGLPMIETALQDLRFGFRMLRRNQGFSILAVLCLILGIGANAAVFSWIEGILFRPYPAVAHQDRMYALLGTVHGKSDFEDLSWPDFVDLQSGCKLIDSFIADKIMGTTLSIGDRAERATGSIVSANYFDALGVHPVLGRGFARGEDSGRNAHPVTVISYRVWKDRFGGGPAIIGKAQMLNGVPHTIVGVAPDDFHGTFVGYAMQFWVPASMEERFENGGYKLEDRGARWIEGFVELKPGVSLRQAQDEISAVAKRLETAYPETNRGRGIRLLPLWQTPFNKANEMRSTLGITVVVVICVLIVACANVGNLLLVRSFARRREMTVRLALGSGRGRLVKQLLTEGLILSAFAATGGIAIAHWCRNLLVPFFPAPGGIVLNLGGELDWRVLALSIGVSIVSTLLFGLLPAIQASNVDLAGALKCDSGGVAGGTGKSRVRLGLVLIQVALSFVLLVGAGLLIQSLDRIRTTSPGFSTQNVLATSIDLFSAGYDPQRAKNFQNELMDRVRALGGIESAALARVRPFTFLPYSSAPIAVDGYQPASDEQPTAEFNEVGPDYFRTMGILLLSGRDFTRSDDETAPLVAVVNETMASRYWSGSSPVGKRVQVKDRWMEIVGLARDSKYQNMLETPKPFLYVPLRQNFAVRVNLMIRTSLGPGPVAAALVREVHALDPGLAPGELITMHEQADRMTSSQQIGVTLLGVFGGLALLLAAIGLYGVMSYTVSQRTREMGLRMALGARTPDLLRLILSQGMALTALGVILGAAGALGLTRLIANLLYHVSPRDPLVFGTAFAVMAIISLAACFLPAWRAAQTDPVGALRE